MCGIRVDGENHFTLAPHPGGHFTYVKAVYDSVYGKVESGWAKRSDGWRFTITIPANCTALLCLPGKEPTILEAGNYTF